MKRRTEDLSAQGPTAASVTVINSSNAPRGGVGGGGGGGGVTSTPASRHHHHQQQQYSAPGAAAVVLPGGARTGITATAVPSPGALAARPATAALNSLASVSLGNLSCRPAHPPHLVTITSNQTHQQQCASVLEIHSSPPHQTSGGSLILCCCLFPDLFVGSHEQLSLLISQLNNCHFLFPN